MGLGKLLKLPIDAVSWLIDNVETLVVAAIHLLVAGYNVARGLAGFARELAERVRSD